MTRLLRTVSLVAAAASLTACGADASRSDDRADGPCLSVGASAVSPGGRFEMFAEKGPEQNGVQTLSAVVRAREGSVEVYRSEPLSTRHGECLVWSPGRELAWIGSKDVGLRVYQPGVDQRSPWTATDPAGVPAADVPEVIRTNHAEMFGGGSR